jgi:hypothetical protein
MPEAEDFYCDWAAFWLNRGIKEGKGPFEGRDFCLQASQAYSAIAQTIILSKIQRELERARKSA